ncbi:response regulator [Nodosilinea sp. LEGE 06152]|uniref:MHYT domain-containing protein n=1 Tax=Nodosilinea sp. LEGE 06152 TaxID=2777966 RepID=UPI0018814BAF|nr:MHYT domain-containing protein [Nodosilinea sp. LEGE 06152]MBE9158450.1 response regulator [Nodosilinea sp. LEGE 06152]
MPYAVVGHYNAGLIGLSLGVAVLASFTTLSLGRQILSIERYQWPWLLGGGLAMGMGIWATHFIGMLALELPVPVSYDILMTGLSLVSAVLAASVALAIVSRPSLGWPGVVAGGWVMGLAIAWMHYTGMAAMEIPAHLSYYWPLVALSVVIAVVASTAALVLNIWPPQRPGQGQPWFAKLAVPTLGIAIGGLHYTAMAATAFQPNDIAADLTNHLTASVAALPNFKAQWLALAVGLGAAVILLLTLIALRINRRLTQQRLQEVALTNSEQRFRSLIREMGVGALLLNAKAEILIRNQAAQLLLHLPEGEGHPLVFGQAGYIQNENGTPFALADLPVQRAIAQKAPLGDVVMGVSATEADPPRWLLVNVDPQLNEAGQVERVVCTCSDITMQKQAEVAVRAVANREKAVMQIVQRMRQTLDLEAIFAATTEELQQALSCDRVWIYRFNPDWSGTVVAEALTDSTAPSTLATATVSDRLIDQDDCGARQLQSGGFDDGYLLLEDTYLQETQAETYRQDRTYHRVNDIYTEGFDTCYLEFLERWQVRAYVIVPIFAGSQLWGLLGIYAHHYPRTWARNEVKMVLQVGTHLGTAVQQADLLRQTQQQAQALAVAKRAADAASQAKSDFLASMSHELRTPLNAILGFTQILHDDDSLDAAHRDLIAIVNRSGNHLLGLVNNVLSLAKIEANKITLNNGVFDLHQLLQAVDDLLQLKAEAKGIQLAVVPPPLPHQLWADESKLRQILINLIGNAIKFTHQGSVVVRSRLHPNLSDPAQPYRLNIEVQDTGVGIDSEEIAHLFQPFHQTQSGRRSAEGTGLGLSLSYNFAQLMGGDITVTSQSGVGSTFTVSLPVGMAAIVKDQPSGVVAAGLEQPDYDIVHLASHQPAPRILVADDVAESRLLIRHWLEGAGFEVREASQGEEAIALWQAWQPHLICLDMRMPVLDGYAVARRVRQLPGGATTTIIAVTASVFEEQRSDCLTAGCDAVLPKPLQRRVLLEHIGRSLNLAYQYTSGSQLDEDSSMVKHRLQETTAAQPDYSGQSSIKDHRPLTEADLSLLTPDWLSQVHQAAQAADDRRVRQLIAQLPPEQDPLAQRLNRLVNDFRLDVIIDLTAVPSSTLSL